MDADEAADFVGGSENKVIERRAVIAKTSFAVGALLGLDVFEKCDRTRANDLRRVRTRGYEGGRQQSAERETGRAGAAALEKCEKARRRR